MDDFARLTDHNCVTAMQAFKPPTAPKFNEKSVVNAKMPGYGSLFWCVEHVWLLSVCHLSLWVGSSGKTGHGVIAGDPTRRAIGQAR